MLWLLTSHPPGNPGFTPMLFFIITLWICTFTWPLSTPRFFVSWHRFALSEVPMPYSYFIFQLLAFFFILVSRFHYLFLSGGLVKGFGADQEKKIWLPEAIPYNWFIWAVYRQVWMKRKVPSNRSLPRDQGWYHCTEWAGKGMGTERDQSEPGGHMCRLHVSLSGWEVSSVASRVKVQVLSVMWVTLASMVWTYEKMSINFSLVPVGF